jgi:Leucine-rich repeat (LRR) protein
MMIDSLLSSYAIIWLLSFIGTCILFPSIRHQFLGIFHLLVEQATSLKQLPQLLEQTYTSEEETEQQQQKSDTEEFDEEDDGDDYFSFSDEEEQILANKAKKKGKSTMVDESTQIDNMDMETLEMRSVLPFRNLRFKKFKSIRADIDVNDISNVAGTKYTLPAPFELVNNREIQRAAAQRRKPILLPTLRINHLYSGENEVDSNSNYIRQQSLPAITAARLLAKQKRTQSSLTVLQLDKKHAKRMQPLHLDNIDGIAPKHERSRVSLMLPDDVSFSEDVSSTTTVDDTDPTHSDDELTDDTLTASEFTESDLRSATTPVTDTDAPFTPLTPDIPLEVTTPSTAAVNTNILDKMMLQSWKNDVETSTQNGVSLSNQYLRIFESVKQLYTKEHENAMKHIPFIKDKTTLTLCNLYFVQIPLILMDAEMLTVLDLSHNYLTNIPNWFFELRNLTTLALNHNLLTELPNSFIELKKLRELDLSHNKFEFIPSSVFHLPALTTLDISHNQISILPMGIIRLKQTLTELNFSYNNIMDIPDDIRSMRKLKYLKYSENTLLYSSHLVLAKLSLEEMKSKKPIRQRSQGLLANIYYLLGNTDDEEMLAMRNEMASQQLSEIPTNAIVKMDILSSEIRYVKYLNIMYEVYYVPLTTASILDDLKREYEFSLSSSYLNIILPQELFAIIQFSRTFLLQLMERMSLWESNPFSLKDARIASLFLDNINNFKLIYGTYPVVYDKAVDFLRELQRVNPEFDRYLKSRARLPILDGMGLESFLLLPIQRIPKYHKLLTNVFKHTREDHPDYASIRKALKKMRELEELHEKNIFIINNKYKILELQRKLKLTDLLVPNRFLLKEGKLTLAQTKGIHNFKKDVIKQIYNRNSVMESVKELNPYLESLKSRLSRDDLWEVRLTEMFVHLYLFSDILVVRETNLIQKLVGKLNIYNLKGAYITEADNDKQQFSIFIPHQNGTKLLTFICSSSKEKTQWYTALNNTISLLNPSAEEADNEGYELDEVETGNTKILDHAYQHHDYNPTGIEEETETLTIPSDFNSHDSTYVHHLDKISPSEKVIEFPIPDEDTKKSEKETASVHSISINKSRSYSGRIRSKEDVAHSILRKAVSQKSVNNNQEATEENASQNT